MKEILPMEVIMEYERRITFREFQDGQHEWLVERNLDTTIQVQAEKWLEEIPEALEALSVLQSNYSTENEKKFAEELVDVMIVSLGLMAIMGMDSEQMIEEKYNHNSIKYDLQTMLQLQAGGMTPRQSIQEMKRRWNETGTQS